MVSFTSFITAAALSGVAFALPRPQGDSAVGIEVAVSAPNGIPLTDFVELASQSAVEAGLPPPTATLATTETPAAQPTPAVYGSDNNQYPNGGELQQPPPNPHDTNIVATTSTSAWISYSTPSYGSGHSNWGGSGYDDCVNQCLASFGAPPASYVPTPATSHSGPTGTGATHTVIVAPTQGVLRFVPPFLNASVGDTVNFKWGANNHTVTRGTALTPCNASTADPFASGVQGLGFDFTEVVNDTNPIYFYCNFPSHCQKGMFGIINPPSNAGGETSFSNMIQNISQSNPDVAAYATYARTQTQGNDDAARWGSNIDMQSVPEWAQPLLAENILYTRTVLAANPELLTDDGRVDLSNSDNTPLVIPEDISDAINNAGSAPAPGSSAAPGAQTAATEAAPSQSAVSNAGNAAGASSGALSLSSSRILVGAAVVVATFFAL